MSLERVDGKCILLVVLLLDQGKYGIDVRGKCLVVIKIAKLIRGGEYLLGYEILNKIDQLARVSARIVIGSMYRSRGDEDYVAGNHVIGSVLYEIVTLALLHVVKLEGAVIMLGSDAALHVFPFVKIIVAVFVGK